MDNINVSDLSGKMPKLNMFNLFPISFSSLGYKIPHMETIGSEDTIMGDIKRKAQEQNELVVKQIDVLVQQNQLFSDNYSKLKDMYDAQERAYHEN